MTAVALGAIVAVVIVVLEMTGTTAAIHLVGKRVVTMTIIAAQFAVTAFERKLRIPAVIEFRVFPADRAVTVSALLAAPSLVGVIVLVAGKAVRRCIQVRRIRVAIEACGLAMMADQGKTGRIMVELRFLPADRGMAITAGGAQALLVGIVVRMAVDADGRRLTVLQARLVAIFTGGFEVLSYQLEIGNGVIESRLIEIDDVGIATDMIGMTTRTSLIAHVVAQAVEAGVLLDIGRDIVVAIETKIVLLCLFEQFVTLAALALEIGMRFDHFAGHDQFFDLGRRSVLESGQCKYRRHSDCNQVAVVHHVACCT